MLWQLCLCIVSIYVLMVWWKNRVFRNIYNQIPICSLSSAPVLGYAVSFMGDAQDYMMNLHKLGREAINKTGMISGWLAHKFYVVVADPVAADVIMNSCLEKSEVMNLAKPLIGNGSIFAPVSIWRPRRKVLAPTFGQNILNSFVKVFAEQSRVMTEKIKSKHGKDKFSIYKHIATYSMDSVCDEKSQTKTLLKLLIESSRCSDLELREETLVMFLAGTDTSAVGASFTSLLLAQYPDVQEKVYNEIQEVLGNSDRSIEVEDLPKLKYLDAVIKESLRMYPPVPVIMRTVEKNISLPTGITLVPGVNIVILIWALHRNPKYWGLDVDVFRPERFFDNQPTHPAAYIPFSYGPRMCLGYKYAMMSMKTILATLIRKYRLLPRTDCSEACSQDKSDPIPTKFDVMLRDINNFELRATIRT